MKYTENMKFGIKDLTDEYNKLIVLILQLDRYKDTTYEKGSTILLYSEMKTLILNQLKSHGYFNNPRYDVIIDEDAVLVQCTIVNNSAHNLITLSGLSSLEHAKGHSFVNVSIREDALYKLDKHDFKIKMGGNINEN